MRVEIHDAFFDRRFGIALRRSEGTVRLLITGDFEPPPRV
jgi:hypothetical protein